MFEVLALAKRRRIVIAAAFAAFAAPLALACVATFAACSTSSNGPNQSLPDASEPEGTSPTAVCPQNAPDAGSACSLPEGTACAFGQCDGVFFTCEKSVWLAAPVTPVASGCPQNMPEAGAQCPACFSASTVCLYEQGCSADAGAFSAGCAPFSTWTITPVACTVPEAGSGDASADEDASEDAGDAGDASTD